MKYIKKYIRFFEMVDVMEPVSKKSIKKEMTPEDVVSRLERVYQELNPEDKNDINSYFENK